MSADQDSAVPRGAARHWTLQCRDRVREFDRPAVMGVVNVTPDSFSDGGRFHDAGRAIDHALAMAADGADIIDVGGESTRPGSQAVPEAQELDRVIPVIEAVRGRVDALVSVDTSKPGIMREAVSAGAELVNDVYALRADGALETAAELGVPVCLMHMQGTPRTMQSNPVYEDVVSEVRGFLAARIEACEAAGIPRDRLCVDPGFGFGKTFEHNLALLRGLGALRALAVPVVAGLSRKSFVGRITGRGMDQRVSGSVAFALAAVREGASVVRVHDVRETVDALKVWRTVYG